MRIVGGKNRSRLIEFPHDANITRPTKDVVREGLFNALSYDVIDKDVLDLFAGSGSLGFEALSRGARSVVFVDNDKTAVQIIKKNANTLAETNITILNADYLKALNEFKNIGKTFDIVFLDPPYKMEIIDEIIDYLLDAQMLNKNAIIVIETDYQLKDNDIRFTKIKSYKYGRTFVTIKRR